MLGWASAFTYFYLAPYRKYCSSYAKSKYNMLSVQKLCQDNNCDIGFDSSSVHVKDKVMRTTLLQVPVMLVSRGGQCVGCSLDNANGPI